MHTNGSLLYLDLTENRIQLCSTLVCSMSNIIAQKNGMIEKFKEISQKCLNRLALKKKMIHSQVLFSKIADLFVLKSALEIMNPVDLSPRSQNLSM